MMYFRNKKNLFICIQCLRKDYLYTIHLRVNSINVYFVFHLEILFPNKKTNYFKYD